jgi:hypothetical protein
MQRSILYLTLYLSKSPECVIRCFNNRFRRDQHYLITQLIGSSSIK